MSKVGLDVGREAFKDDSKVSEINLNMCVCIYICVWFLLSPWGFQQCFDVCKLYIKNFHLSLEQVL